MIERIADQIIALERAALDRWGKGDPDGFLEITDPDIVYYDPFQPQGIHGREALAALYDTFRGQVSIERDEILSPRVQVSGDIAVLTFNYVSYGSEGSMRWNTTEVYRRRGDTWRIIHTHWSKAASRGEGRRA